MSTMQDKIVGKMCGNVLYHSGIVIVLFLVPYVQIRAGFDLLFFFFYSFAVKAALDFFIFSISKILRPLRRQIRYVN